MEIILVHCDICNDEYPLEDMTVTRLGGHDCVVCCECKSISEGMGDITVFKPGTRW